MIGIIGAGLTGLATAFYLKEPAVIFEKEKEPVPEPAVGSSRNEVDGNRRDPRFY